MPPTHAPCNFRGPCRKNTIILSVTSFQHHPRGWRWGRRGQERGGRRIRRGGKRPIIIGAHKESTILWCRTRLWRVSRYSVYALDFVNGIFLWIMFGCMMELPYFLLDWRNENEIGTLTTDTTINMGPNPTISQTKTVFAPILFPLWYNERLFVKV